MSTLPNGYTLPTAPTPSSGAITSALASGAVPALVNLYRTQMTIPDYTTTVLMNQMLDGPWVGPMDLILSQFLHGDTDYASTVYSAARLALVASVASAIMTDVAAFIMANPQLAPGYVPPA